MTLRMTSRAMVHNSMKSSGYVTPLGSASPRHAHLGVLTSRLNSISSKAVCGSSSSNLHTWTHGPQCSNSWVLRLQMFPIVPLLGNTVAIKRSICDQWRLELRFNTDFIISQKNFLVQWKEFLAVSQGVLENCISISLYLDVMWLILAVLHNSVR